MENQNTADERIKMTIGTQFVQIQILLDQVEALSRELASLKAADTSGKKED